MAKSTPLRLLFSLKTLALLALVLMAGVGTWVGILALSPYSVPARKDIAEVSVTYPFYTFEERGRQIPPFQIPEKHWDAVLGALAPCNRDPSPAKWMSLCDLRIRTKAHRVYCVGLYWLPDAPRGAFSVYPEGRHSQRTYYRGGDSVQLRDAIVAAYDEQSPIPRTRPEESR